MIEFENLRFRLLESEKPIQNLKEALAIDLIKKRKQRRLIFGMIWKKARKR